MTVDSSLERIFVLAGFSSQSLETNPDVIYVVDRFLNLVYCNAAWDVFARENKGEQLARDKFIGKYCLNGVPEFLRDLYKRIYSKVLRTGTPWEHDYQCSSPTKYRIFHMRILPLKRSHLLIENSLALECSHRRTRHRKLDARYINRRGWIIMCSHCRRIEHFNPKGKREWHWVPSYLITAPAPISHGLCPACISYHLKLTIDGQL
jgi:PAS fold